MTVGTSYFRRPHTLMVWSTIDDNIMVHCTHPECGYTGEISSVEVDELTSEQRYHRKHPEDLARQWMRNR